MGRLVLLLVFFLQVLAPDLRAQDVPGRYVWPIAGYINISAGFCDYRTRHYHGGIDLSTNGQEGLPVRAADSGWIGRISIGYWGYGKGVYVQMADGRMAVYGHLSELADKIREYVEDAQYKTEKYDQNLFPARNEIPIARGEVIGLSGQTGAGPPHLHFEIRTGDNKPLNPLDFFEKRDAIRPSIYSITVTPIQPGDIAAPPSTVDGSLEPKTFPLTKGALSASPRITGAVGISVLADDHIDAPRWTMSAYSHRLIVNGQVQGEVRYDSINYDNTRQIDIERLYDPDGGIDTRAVNLFRREQNTLWHYQEFSKDGILRAGEPLDFGRNTIRIEVEDKAGNTNGIEFSLVADTVPQRATLPTSAAPMGATLSWGGAVLAVPSNASAPPDISLDPEGIRKITQWIRSRGGWQAWLPAAAGADVLWLRNRPNADRDPVTLGWRPIRVHDGGLLSSDDGKATVTFAPGDLYTSGAFSLKESEAGKNSGAMTRLYTLAPREVPFARDLRIQIALPKSSIPIEKLGIYRRQGGSWSFEGNTRAQDWNALTATIRSAGAFAILADRQPPSITGMTPARDAAISQRRPTIRFQVSDALSGIGTESNLSMTVDGKWVPVEYDPDLKWAKSRPRWELDPGRHRIEIVARDRAGNETRVDRAFTVRK